MLIFSERGEQAHLREINDSGIRQVIRQRDSPLVRTEGQSPCLNSFLWYNLKESILEGIIMTI